LSVHNTQSGRELREPHFTRTASRDEIARKHGFETFGQLAALPKAPGDEFWSYVARGRDGRWFLWKDWGEPEETKE